VDLKKLLSSNMIYRVLPRISGTESREIMDHGPGITFQHDNARPHTARVVGHVLNENDVDVLPWPANMPDLSPIEHVWDGAPITSSASAANKPAAAW
jgi:hypothetical protein